MSNTPFFNELVQLLDDKVNNKTALKWYMNSAHDTTVAQILAGLNFTSKECVSDKFFKGKTDAFECVSSY